MTDERTTPESFTVPNETEAQRAYIIDWSCVRCGGRRCGGRYCHLTGLWICACLECGWRWQTPKRVRFRGERSPEARERRRLKQIRKMKVIPNRYVNNATVNPVTGDATK